MSWAVTSHFLTPPVHAGSNPEGKPDATGCAKLKFSHVRDMYEGGATSKLSQYARSSSGLVKINHGASGNPINNYNPISEYDEVNKHHSIPLQNTSNGNLGLKLSHFHSVGKEFIIEPANKSSQFTLSDGGSYTEGNSTIYPTDNLTSSSARKKIVRCVINGIVYNNSVYGANDGALNGQGKNGAIKVVFSDTDINVIVHNRGTLYGSGGIPSTYFSSTRKIFHNNFY